MAEPNGYIQGHDGKPIELVDATARNRLAGKLDAPGSVKAGDYLRVQSIGADGTVVLEGAEGTGNGSGQNVEFRDALPNEIFVLGVGTGGDSGGGEIPPDVTTYTVLNVLTGVSTSNPAAVVAENAAYTATITADEGYTLKSIVVKMGGVDISATAVNGNTISIPAVTGNVVITAKATEVLPIPTDGLVVFYDMSRENVNNTIVDETGNGYDIEFRKNSNNGSYVDGYITYDPGVNYGGAFVAPVSGDTCTMLFTISEHNAHTSTVEPYALLRNSYSVGEYQNRLAFGKSSVQVEGKTAIPSTPGLKQVVGASVDVGDTTTAKLYLDGKLDVTGEGLENYAFNAVELLAGISSGPHMKTRMYNFALYNRVLTDDEVAEISAILLDKAGGNM